jgi:glycerophosphoryl diester phosphodiesterase
VSGLDSLAGLLGSLRAAQKTPLLDLSTLGLTLDNLEGITFGPDLPDGRRSLVVISDNNFTPGQFSQVLLFAVSKS